jgi:hypothetical protein
MSIFDPVQKYLAIAGLARERARERPLPSPHPTQFREAASLREIGCPGHEPGQPITKAVFGQEKVMNQ